MSTMTLYYNTKRQAPENVKYPIEKQVNSIEDLRQVTAYDHVCAEYESNYRKKDFFVRADVSMFDVDNMETDNSEDWIFPEDVRDKFPDVPFYVCFSRNHMKEKNGKTARPKFHVYFPHKMIDNVKEYEKLKDGVCSYLSRFDQNAKDSARFFFGVENPVVEFYDGNVLLNDFINSILVSQNMMEKSQFSNEETILEENQISDEEIIPEGKRNNTLFRFAVKILTRWGNKSDKAYQFYLEETKKCRPPLDEQEIQSIWRSTVKFYQEKISSSRDYIPPELFHVRESQLKPSDFTDLGQAYVFYKEYGDITAYSVATFYLYFDGKVWIESEPKVHGLVQELTERQLKEAVSELKKAQYYENKAAVNNDSGSKKDNEDKGTFAKKYRNYVLRYRDTRRISAVLREVQPMLNIDVNLLDNNGFILNTPNGEVDLYTGEMKKHNPQNYCTKITKVSPSDKGMELFEKFLDQITCGDKELQNYLQLISGMGAVGKVFHENLIIAYGSGKNGKSTFFNLISKVMGDYSGQLSSETLLSNPTKNKSPEYAELRGRRFVTVSELDEDKFLDTAMMKKLCSTDDIFAEKKYKAPFSFTPSHTIILCTNHLPRVSMSDGGTWRRLMVVPFEAVIDSDTEIKNYAEYLYEQAGGAVLSWIIEGAVKYLKTECHIDIPKAVKKATEQYRSENDWLNNYLSECCEKGKDYEILTGELYKDFLHYCEQTGEEKKSQQAFGRALTNAGYQKIRKNIGGHTVRMWKGLSILPKDFTSYLEPYVPPYVSPKVQKDIVTDNDGIDKNFFEEDVVF